MRTRALIRHPKEGEYLEGLFPTFGQYEWNLTQVWVAELDGDLAAGAIEWDGGHSIVALHNFIVREPYRTRGVGFHLLMAIREDLRERGKQLLVGETTNVDMAYWSKKRGAKVSGPAFLVVWRI